MAEASTLLLSPRRVSERFANGTLALQDMTLDVGDHDFSTFLGPSGSGKSTALRRIAGRSSARGGGIAWHQPRASGTDKTEPALGFVFQEPTPMPWATVFDNADLPLRRVGVGRGAAVAKVLEALAMVGSSRFSGRLPARAVRRHEDARVDRAPVTHPRRLPMDELPPCRWLACATVPEAPPAPREPDALQR